ncbi:MAG: ATP-binding protein, partial [Oscillospiraceae bacterium]
DLLGIPFFKMSAESTGGSFSIRSQKGVGTVTEAVYILSSIDRMPLGDITGTIHSLVTLNPDIDFLYTYSVDGRSFVMDTREFREILGDVSFAEAEVSNYINDYLTENKDETDCGVIL